MHFSPAGWGGRLALAFAGVHERKHSTPSELLPRLRARIGDASVDDVRRDVARQSAAAVILAAACAVAVADPVCAPWGDTTDITFEFTTDSVSPTCMPDWAGGPGRGGVALNTAGATAWVYCPTKYSWRGFRGAITHAALAERVAEIPAFLAAPDRVALVASWSQKYPLEFMGSDTLLPVWCPHYAAIRAARPANPKYTVATNGLTLTRPTRTVTPAATGSALGAQSLVRVAVGAPCRCDRIAIEGSPLYCQVLDAQLVAVCKAAP